MEPAFNLGQYPIWPRPEVDQVCPCEVGASQVGAG
jgi:hypothetical protein